MNLYLHKRVKPAYGHRNYAETHSGKNIKILWHKIEKGKLTDSLIGRQYPINCVNDNAKEKSIVKFMDGLVLKEINHFLPFLQD